MCALLLVFHTDVDALRAARGVEQDTVSVSMGRLCPPETVVTGFTTASGDAERLVEPDVGRVSFTVVVTRNAFSDARLAGNRVLNETITALMDLPYISESDIEADQFSLLPNYDYDVSADSFRLTGWTFTQGFSTTVRRDAAEDTRVGQLIDIAIYSNENALHVNDIEFCVSRTASREVLDELRVEAVQRAMKTAAVLIGATGAQMGGVTQISDSSYIPYQSYMMDCSSSDGLYPHSDVGSIPDIPISVHKGTMKLSSTASVTVEICM
jgi:uncharacterized protein YggE